MSGGGLPTTMGSLTGCGGPDRASGPLACSGAGPVYETKLDKIVYDLISVRCLLWKNQVKGCRVIYLLINSKRQVTKVVFKNVLFLFL